MNLWKAEIAPNIRVNRQDFKITIIIKLNKIKRYKKWIESRISKTFNNKPKISSKHSITEKYLKLKIYWISKRRWD